MTEPVRGYHSADPVEDALLEAIWKSPADDHARSVYMDWLEQHGHTARLAFLQREPTGQELLSVSPHDDADWRAIVARPTVIKCPRPVPCDAPWSSLAPTDNDRLRTCGTCQQQVVYCTSASRPPVPFVCDGTLDPAVMKTPQVIPYGNPPPPQHYGPPPTSHPSITPAPPPPGTFVRIVNWLRRRS